jgi:perosamine synthetase
MSIPLCIPDLSRLERSYAAQAVDSTWISSTGPWISRAEHLIASAAGRSEAVVTSSGTTALHLALAALGIGPGDEVVVPAIAYVAVANAVAYTGATPVFADVDADTWCLSRQTLDAVVTQATKAVIYVDIYGRLGRIAEVQAYCHANGLHLVEDAAEAHGASNASGAAGSFGTLSIFSYYGNKILTSGEGGAILVDDPEMADRLRLLRGQGMDPSRRYYFPVIGFNYRMTNVAAAILTAQYERFRELWEQRQRVYAVYTQGLIGVAELSIQGQIEGESTAPWFFSLTLKGSGSERRDALMAHLGGLGVETRPFFIPLHTLPAHRRSQEFPVATHLGCTGLNLPTFPGLSDRQVKRIVEAIQDFV